MLEFVIAFPVVLTLILACVQFAHLLIARQVVHYAAFCAARAALVTVCEPALAVPSESNDSWPLEDQLKFVGLDSQNCTSNSIGRGRNGKAASEAEWAGCQAAARICKLIAIWDPQRNEFPEQMTRAIVQSTADGPPTANGPPPWNVKATVEHDFALIVPIVGPMLAWGMNPWDKDSPWGVTTADATGDRWSVFPRIRLLETVVLPKPYKTLIAAGDWRKPGTMSW